MLLATHLKRLEGPIRGGRPRNVAVAAGLDAQDETPRPNEGENEPARGEGWSNGGGAPAGHTSRMAVTSLGSSPTARSRTAAASVAMVSCRSNDRESHAPVLVAGSRAAATPSAMHESEHVSIEPPSHSTSPLRMHHGDARTDRSCTALLAVVRICSSPSCGSVRRSTR